MRPETQDRCLFVNLVVHRIGYKGQLVAVRGEEKVGPTVIVWCLIRVISIRIASDALASCTLKGGLGSSNHLEEPPSSES